MTSPRNTSSNMDAVDALEVLACGIEAQERRGQQELLQATTLPTDTSGRDAEFEALGFEFGAQVNGDPLFREAKLPAGWSRAGTEHAMWSQIVDERGLERVGIFYKAAFYDRRASMSITNVGAKIASQFIYGDDAAPTLHPELTPGELAAARSTAEDYKAQAEVYPDIYGDRLPRAEAFLEALGPA